MVCKAVILLCLLFLIHISFSQGAFRLTDYKENIEYIPSEEKSSTELSEGGSSKKIIEAPKEYSPISIIRTIITPKRGGDVFRNEPIEVLVKITTQKTDGLKQIEFWELPEDDLKLDRCSYQIRTSNISQMRYYEEHDDSLLDDNDIINTASLISILNDDSANEPRKQLYSYISRQLSNDTSKLLYEYILNQSQQDDENLALLLENLNQTLLSDFNEMIENNSIDLFVLFAKCDINIDRTRVKSLNPNSSSYTGFKDYRLHKRLMLEHIFPKMIRNLSIIKDHECRKIFGYKNEINISEKNLRQGETILFKYYLYPTKLGLKDIRYIVRADGYVQEGTETISVSERGEEFSIDYWCDSKDLTRNKPEIFIYNVEYTGGNGEENQFPLSVQLPGGCKEIVVSWEEESGSKDGFNEMHNGTWRSESEVPFSKGIIKKLNVTAVFNVPGLRISPPTIKIGNYTKYFEPDLAVYAEYDSLFRIHYDFYSIFLTIAAILISLIIAIFSSVELYLAQREINLIHKEIDVSNAVIERNNEIFEDLMKKLK